MTVITSCSAFLFITLLFIAKEINCSRSPRVVIVGAGAAGIAAAAKLIENNITNIKILEAKNRIGGRIHSVKFGDAMIDLGAEWCYGEKGNVVYEMVKDYDILTPGEQMLTLYASKPYELDLALENELYNIFHSIYIKDLPDGHEMCLGEYMANEYNKIVLEKYGHHQEKLKFAEEFFRFLLKAILLNEGAFSIDDVAAKSDFKKCELNCGSTFKGVGFKTVLDILMKRYPDPQEQLPINEKILFNKEVVTVAWDKNSGYEDVPLVQCLDGTIYKADHIIFTPSLGVLKYHYGSLFQPALPEEKITAIKDIGFGSLLKVFLYFPIKWWPSSNFSDFSFLWLEEDIKHYEHNLPEVATECCRSNHQCTWLLDLVGIYAVQENPNVLEAIFVGSSVPMIEKCSDEAVIDGIMYIINKFVGRHFDNMSMPDYLIRQNWYSDPHFRGSFSFQTVQSRKKGISQQRILAEPVTSSSGKYSLLFAGEATHPNLFSTVNGAIETGYREAERIISLYKRNATNEVQM